MKRSSISKRSWAPFLDKKTGKWYTGYESASKPDFVIVNADHEVRTLKLTPTSTQRGRSSANMFFEDEEGYRYSMGLDGGFQLIKKLLKGEVQSEGEYLICDFVQVKRGANLLIEAVEEE